MTLFHDFKVAPEPADFWGWVREGRYDAEWNILAKLVRPEHTFIDLGAWVGSHSLHASLKTKKVIAVEPDPVAFAILEENARLNDGCYHTIRLAIGEEGVVTLGSGFLGASTTRSNPAAGGGIGPWETGHRFLIDSISLRTFCEKYPDPLFIKMDVEGSEEMILRDVEFFRERKPTMYLELHPWWWKDEAATWEAVKVIANLYKYVRDLHFNLIDVNQTRSKVLVLHDISL